MEYSETVRNRLRRIEGQVRGVLNMMENARDCPDVVTQLTAVRSAVDKTIAAIVVNNLETCLRRDIEQDSDTTDTVQQALELIMRSRG